MAFVITRSIFISDVVIYILIFRLPRKLRLLAMTFLGNATAFYLSHPLELGGLLYKNYKRSTAIAVLRLERKLYFDYSFVSFSTLSLLALSSCGLISVVAASSVIIVSVFAQGLLDLAFLTLIIPISSNSSSEITSAT